MKKRIRKTGEIVDVVAWYNLMGAERDKYDSVSYIDSKGNECVKVEGLNLAWDFEDVEEVLSTDIDWKQMNENQGGNISITRVCCKSADCKY